MKKIILLLLISCNSFGQTWGDSSVLEHDIFAAVQETPKFINGSKGLYEFIAANMNIPATKRLSLMNNLIEVKIVISKTGEVVYGNIVKGVNEECNKAILDLISKMPPWTPAKQNNRNVYCYITIPIIIL